MDHETNNFSDVDLIKEINKSKYIFTKIYQTNIEDMKELVNLLRI